MSERLSETGSSEENISLPLSTILELTDAPDPDAVYRWGIEVLDRFLDADVISVGITTDDLIVPVASTLYSRTGRDHAVPIETSLPGAAVLSGEGCLVRDRQDIRRVAPTSSNGEIPKTTADNFRSVVCAPIPGTGVIVAQARQPGRFNDQDLELSNTIGQVIGNVASNTQNDTPAEPLLEEIGSMVSHDLRNKVNIAIGRIDLARRTGEDEHLDQGLDALEGVERIADVVVSLAQTGDPLTDLKPVNLEEAAQVAFRPLDSQGMRLSIKASATILADPDCLAQLLENLFRNSIEHHDEAGIIELGLLEDGFYVSDDGPGIPEDIRDRVIELGYSTAAGHQGKGLTIVTRLADAHGWDIEIEESTMGGARIEVQNVVFQ